MGSEAVRREVHGRHTLSLLYIRLSFNVLTSLGSGLSADWVPKLREQLVLTRTKTHHISHCICALLKSQTYH